MNTVVYFPHFYPSTNWLKTAAFCWDKVYTLVTKDSPPPSEELIETNNALGNILDTISIPNLVYSEESLQQFESWIKKRADKIKSAPWELDNKHLVELFPSKLTDFPLTKLLQKNGLVKFESNSNVQIPKWELNRSKNRNLSSNPFEEFNRFGFEYSSILGSIPSMPVREAGSDYDKYLDLIDLSKKKRDEGDLVAAQKAKDEADEIKKKNLIEVPNQHDLSAYLPKDVALHFLSFCASVAAKDGNRDLIAANDSFTDSIFHNYNSLSGEVSKTVLEAFLPKDLSKINFEQIKEIKSKLSSSRLRYQNEIQSLCNEFEKVGSQGAIEKIKDGIVAIANEKIEETKKAYKYAKVETIITTLGVTLTPPALITSVASILGIGIFSPAGLIAAFSSTVGLKYLEFRKAKLEKIYSPWSYVLEIDKRLN